MLATRPTQPGGAIRGIEVGGRLHRFPYILNRVRAGRAEGAVNRTKHGVSFEEAGTVFGDPDALDGPDLRHSEEKSRFLRLGRAATGRVLSVAYTAGRRGDGESIRIISARRASCKERAAYAASRD